MYRVGCRKSVMAPLSLLVLSVLSIVAVSEAQQRLMINKIQICSYDGSVVKDDLYSFDSDDQAKEFVARIMKFTGLPQNFEIKAANVSNASAVIEGDTRLILYNQSYIQDVMKKTNTSWSAISIMAHEIGHHLSGHTLSQLGGSRPDKELEADKFSGHVLFQMGATLEQARAAMESLADKPPSPNYPPKSARLAAIYNGWTSAKDEAAAAHKSDSQATTPSTEEKPEPKTAKKKPPADDPDAEPDPPKKSKPKVGYHCYDYFGYPRCVISPPGYIGNACFCYGQGSGVIGP